MREQHDPFREQHHPSHEGSNELRIKSYDIVRRIDVGGMGEVYLARQHTAFNREVAIKIIRPDLVYDTSARRRFRREAEVNAYIKHEHILSLIEFNTSEDGRLFFVTPYIAGGTLAQRLRAGALSPSEVYQLFVPLVQAVAYIHQHRVIHRDLKPSNILLDLEVTPGQIFVRLMDFGIAAIQGETADPPLTTAGHEMGTLAYMAPERLDGTVAPSIDIFSLGIILYQMITGHLPSAEHQEQLPEPLDYVVKRCIATQPEDRFATAEELLETFVEAYHYLQGHPQRHTTSSRPAVPMVADDVASGPSGLSGRSHASRPPIGIGIHQPEVNVSQRADLVVEPASLSVPVSSTGLRPHHPNNFKQEDHESPTVNFHHPDVLSQRGNSGAHTSVQANSGAVSVPGRSHHPVKPRRSRLVTAIALLSVLVLLVMAALFLFAFQSIAAPTATINFAPQVQVIKQAFSIQAEPSTQAVDVASSSIPAKLFTSKKTGVKMQTTTGQSCFLFICQQTVSATDESTLIAEVKSSLVVQINQDLQNQVQTNNAHAVGTVQTTDVSETTTPTVGSVSKTVTVTLTEEGQIEYIKDSDAQQLAQGLLQQQVQQLGGNYTLIGSSVQTGHPVVENIDTNGVVSLKIAAAGLAQYHFPKSQLSAMQNAMKGLKLATALAYLRQQPGVDAHTVSIHLSSGDTMPADMKQMMIVPINPTTLPPLSLPTVSAPATVTPTNTPTN